MKPATVTNIIDGFIICHDRKIWSLFFPRIITGSPGDRGVTKLSPGMWWEGRKRVHMNNERDQSLGCSKSTADFQLAVTYLLIDICIEPQ